jgi:flagellar biosynthesis protein FlhG
MRAESKKARRIAVISGKGGVGKTVITANLAAGLAANGRRILVVDADLGLANLDIVLGLDPQFTLQDVFRGARKLDDVLLHTTKGFDLLPAGSGGPEAAAVSAMMAVQMESLLGTLETRYDVILFDAGAGIGEVVFFFAHLANEILLIATPEPTSLADCYATIKLLKQLHGRSEFLLVVNQANPGCPGQIGSSVANHLQKVISQFIQPKDNSPVNIKLLGSIPLDPAIPHAIKNRQLLKEISPQAPSTCQIKSIADLLQDQIACA